MNRNKLKSKKGQFQKGKIRKNDNLEKRYLKRDNSEQEQKDSSERE